MPNSPQSTRLLGKAIALAALTGLLAHGCERARHENPPAAPATPAAAKPAPQPASQPAPAAKPADAPTPPGATTPAPKPQDPPKETPKEAVKDPVKDSAKDPAKPGDAQPDKPTLPPIPHTDLAEDAKPLREFTTPTGVIVQEFKAGKGALTLPKALVTVHLVLHLKDGWKKVESSYDKGEPLTDTLDNFVLGFSDGVIGMQPGASRRIIVPADRGFGQEGAKDQDGNVVVPPGATIVFDVDLVSNTQKIMAPKPPAPAAGADKKNDKPEMNK